MWQVPVNTFSSRYLGMFVDCSFPVVLSRVSTAFPLFSDFHCLPIHCSTSPALVFPLMASVLLAASVWSCYSQCLWAWMQENIFFRQNVHQYEFSFSNKFVLIFLSTCPSSYLLLPRFLIYSVFLSAWAWYRRQVEYIID